MFRKAVAAADELCGKLVLLLVNGYRFFISPILGCNCRFYPSCSEYAKSAIELYGAWRGGWLVLKRVARCHPWNLGGYDPVPTPTPTSGDIVEINSLLQFNKKLTNKMYRLKPHV